jgi:prepilin-type processing-associated H-X9-DG protein
VGLIGPHAADHAGACGGNSAALRLSHHGRSNYLFFDLHVECLGPLERVAPGTTAANESTASPNMWFGAE